MTIGKRLLIGFSLVIGLAGVMCFFSLWSVGQISTAHEAVSNALSLSSEAQSNSYEIDSALGKIREVRSEFNAAQGDIYGALLSNAPRISLYRQEGADPVAQMIADEELSKLLRTLSDGTKLLEGLGVAHGKLMTSEKTMRETWKQSHEGLVEDLEGLKRTQLYWTLKVANSLFVKSSISELLYEELGDTPVEEFKSGELYENFSSQIPLMKEVFQRVSEANKELWDASYALNKLIFQSKWEEARKFYRDSFPATVKSMAVDLDKLIQQEQIIASNQRRVYEVLNGDFKAQSEGVFFALNSLESRLFDLQALSGQSVGAAALAVSEKTKVVDESLSGLRRTNIILASVVLVVGSLCGYLITRSITHPLYKTVDMFKKLEAGELGNRLKLSSNDEVGDMARAIDAFADNLEYEVITAFEKLASGDFTFKAHGVVGEPLAKANFALNDLVAKISTIGSLVASGSDRVSEASASQASGASAQASSLEEITTSVNDMASRISVGADSAEKAHTVVSEARTAAERGNQRMGQMVSAMEEIKDAGQNISKIIKTIDEIAFQTNLLALNAAVEAARAGQHGKGFAVVAEEVRSLAGRSAKAASETAELIEGAVHKTERGARIANETAGALDQILTGMETVNDLVAGIATSSREQAQGISHVNQGLEQIDQVTQTNTASSEESAAAAEELAEQATQMMEMLGRFKLESVGIGAPVQEWDSEFVTDVPLLEEPMAKAS